MFILKFHEIQSIGCFITDETATTVFIYSAMLDLCNLSVFGDGAYNLVEDKSWN